MPRHHSGKGSQIIRRHITPPSHMQIGTHEQPIAAIDPTRTGIRNIKHTQRRFQGCERRSEARYIGLRTPKPQQRKAAIIADAMMFGMAETVKMFRIAIGDL